MVYSRYIGLVSHSEQRFNGVEEKNSWGSWVSVNEHLVIKLVGTNTSSLFTFSQQPGICWSTTEKVKIFVEWTSMPQNCFLHYTLFITRCIRLIDTVIQKQPFLFAGKYIFIHYHHHHLLHFLHYQLHFLQLQDKEKITYMIAKPNLWVLYLTFLLHFFKLFIPIHTLISVSTPNPTMREICG